ncbi:endonuclease dU [Methanofollis fontis]|uniref:UPF0215 protein CUJ86_08130 n=1 Tax=Methanofollis fontis TaxID=2052832 RepID=A0A483CN04_9EURY|nr:DUF99 family protein [Methanofollis fontis]TAJ44002.1 DUF99 domain-containing protein [Methanofollis fontis]
MHTGKTGLRTLGVAESFVGGGPSVLAGVVMRKDLLIDGIAYSEASVGGMDATDAVIALYESLGRRDINLIMLSGCVIAWYNIIEPARVSQATGCPVIVVTYEDSEGLEDDISTHFPDDTERLAAYRRLGERSAFTPGTGHTLYYRAEGIEHEAACQMIDALTLAGRVPEPLRVARLAARAVMRWRCLPK